MLTKKNVCKAMIIVLLFGFLWGSLFLFNTNFIVNADSDSVDINELTSNEVPATYTFTRIDDNNCSVRILNKTDATKAVIPATATIDGDSYTVTEIAVNGFMSSSKLKRVFIPSTIKKINNTAFANCPVLESISLSQVETIGSNVFMMCASLEEIIIPQTVTTVGSSIFRNNNTHVQLRAASTGSNWSASWNTGNNNQEVVYNCQVIEELVVEPLYRKTMTRSSNNEVVGYSIASGQPFSDPYYEQIGNNLILHSNIDGKPLLDVEQYAFEYNHIETFLIEYSETPLNIRSWAYMFAEIEEVIINRKITFYDPDIVEEDKTSQSIFASSTIEKIAYPETASGIAPSMFDSCFNLEDIYFIQPEDGTVEEQFGILSNVVSDGKIELPELNDFNTIGASAFAFTTLINEININDKINNIGAGAFHGWEENQKITVDYTCGLTPEFDAEMNTGFHIDWLTGCSAEVTYSSYQLIYKNHFDSDIIIASQIVEIGSKVGELAPAISNENPDLSFMGWYDINDVKYNSDIIFEGNVNIALVPKWGYKITYYDPTKIINPYIERIYDINSNIEIPSFTKAGYNSYLIHDYTGNRYDTGDLYYVGGPTTFTVNWTEKPLAECYNQYQFYYAVYGPNQLKELRTSNLSNRKVHIMNDIDVSNEDWISIPEIDFELNGKGYTITFKNESVSTNENFGFANLCSGWIYDLNFKAKIRTNEADSTSTKQYIGVIAAELRGGVIENCKLLSYNEGTNFYYYSSTSTNVDVLILNPKAITGGLTGLHYGNGLQYSENIGCAIASYGTLGGISGESHKYIGYCKNRAPLFYELKEGDGRRAVGGISGYHESNHNLSDCENYGNITFVSVISGNTGNSPAMAQIVGYDYMKYNESCIIDYTCSGNVIVNSTIGNDYKTYVKNTAIGYSSNQEELPVGGGCVASGTLITLADGRQVPVEELKGDELLLVWNLQTGTFDIAPILFIDSEIADVYNVIVLKFSDGTQVKVIYEHAFWDIDLNRYVFLRDDATNYIGHWFNKQEMNEEGNLNWKKVQLIEVVFQQEYTIAWSPVTYSHLCYYVNGMLSMPGNTEGFVNIFEVDADTMKVNEELYLEDIEQYGLYTYEEFTQIIQIPESVFDAFNGQYLKVAIGKGYLDVERLRALVNRYSIFFN